MKELDSVVVEAVLEDWRTAPVPERLRAMLGFLEKLTLRPGEVGADDVRALRAAGLSDVAIQEGIYVCFLFSILDRIADALDFRLPPPEAGRKTIDQLHRYGYRMVKLPG